MHVCYAHTKEKIYEIALKLYLLLPGTCVSDDLYGESWKKSNECLLRLMAILEEADYENLEESVEARLLKALQEVLHDAVNKKIVPNGTAVYAKIALRRFLGGRKDNTSISLPRRDDTLTETRGTKAIVRDTMLLITEELQKYEREKQDSDPVIEAQISTYSTTTTVHKRAVTLHAIAELYSSLTSIGKWVKNRNISSLIDAVICLLEYGLKNTRNITSWSQNSALHTIFTQLRHLIVTMKIGDLSVEGAQVDIEYADVSLQKLIECVGIHERMLAERVTTSKNEPITNSPGEYPPKVKVVDCEDTKNRALLREALAIRRVILQIYYSTKDTDSLYSTLIHSLKEDMDFLCISEVPYVTQVNKTALENAITKITRKSFAMLYGRIFPHAHKELFEVYKSSISLAQSLQATPTVGVEAHSYEVGKILDQLFLVDKFFISNTSQCTADMRVLHARVLVEGCIAKLFDQGLERCSTDTHKMLARATLISRDALGAEHAATLILEGCVASIRVASGVFSAQQEHAVNLDVVYETHTKNPPYYDVYVALVDEIKQHTLVLQSGSSCPDNSLSPLLSLLESHAKHLLHAPASASTLLNPSLFSSFPEGYSFSSILGICPRTWSLLEISSDVMCIATSLMGKYLAQPSADNKTLMQNTVKRLLQTERETGHLQNDAVLMIFRVVTSALDSLIKTEATNNTEAIYESGESRDAWPTEEEHELLKKESKVSKGAINGSHSPATHVKTLDRAETARGLHPFFVRADNMCRKPEEVTTNSVESCGSTSSRCEILGLSVSKSFENNLRDGSIEEVSYHLKQAHGFLDFIVKTHHEDDELSLTPHFIADVKEARGLLCCASKELENANALNSSVLDHSRRLLAVLQNKLHICQDHADLDLKSTPSIVQVDYKDVLQIIAYLEENKRDLSALQNSHVRAHMHSVLGKIEEVFSDSILMYTETQVAAQAAEASNNRKSSADFDDASLLPKQESKKVHVRAKEALQFAEDNIDELNDLLCEHTGLHAEQVLHKLKRAFVSLARARSLIGTSINRSVLNAAVSCIASSLDNICGDYYKTILPAAPILLSNSIGNCKRLSEILDYAFKESLHVVSDDILSGATESARGHLLQVTRALQHLDINSDVIGIYAIAPIAHKAVRSCLRALYDAKLSYENPNPLRSNVHLNVAIYACRALDHSLLQHIELCSSHAGASTLMTPGLSHTEIQALNLYEASIRTIEASDRICRINGTILRHVSHNLKSAATSCVDKGSHIFEHATAEAALGRMCSTVSIIARQERELTPDSSCEEGTILLLRKVSTLMARALCGINCDYKETDSAIWSADACLPVLPGEVSKDVCNVTSCRYPNPGDTPSVDCETDSKTIPTEKEKCGRSLYKVVLYYIKAFFMCILRPIAALYRLFVRSKERRNKGNAHSCIENITQKIAELPKLSQSHAARDPHVLNALEGVSESCKNGISISRLALSKRCPNDIREASCSLISSDIITEHAINMLSTRTCMQEVTQFLTNLGCEIRNLEKLLPTIADCIVHETSCGITECVRRDPTVGSIGPTAFISYEVLSAGWWCSTNGSAGLEYVAGRIRKIYGSNVTITALPRMIDILCSQRDIQALNFVCKNFVAIDTHGESGLQRVLDVFAQKMRPRTTRGKRVIGQSPCNRTGLMARPALRGAALLPMLVSLIKNSCKTAVVGGYTKYSLRHCRLDDIIKALCTVASGGVSGLRFLLNDCCDGVIYSNTFARCLKLCGGQRAAIIEQYMGKDFSLHRIYDTMGGIICTRGEGENTQSEEIMQHRNKSVFIGQQNNSLQSSHSCATNRPPKKEPYIKTLSQLSAKQAEELFGSGYGKKSEVCGAHTNCGKKELGVESEEFVIVYGRASLLVRGREVTAEAAAYSGPEHLLSVDYADGNCYKTVARNEAGRRRVVMTATAVTAVFSPEKDGSSALYRKVMG